MDPREQFLSEQREYFDERNTDRQENIDAGTAAKIIRGFGLNPNAVRRREGDNLSLTWLWEQHPESPVKIKAQHIRSWDFTELFTRFTATHIYDAFEDAVDCYPDQTYLGSVFHANKLGDMIIHNWPRAFDGTQILPGSGAKRYGRLSINQFKHFLPVFCAEWSPVGYPLGGA